MREAAAAAVLALLAGSARAAEISSRILDPAPITPREAFLGAGIGAIIACGMTSFFLAGRVSERTHVALAMLVVLVGGFCLFTLFGLVGREIPLAGSLVLLGLIGLFKLMNQFEIRRKPSRSDK
jgi:CHASE2 domain-containing sensor protein